RTAAGARPPLRLAPDGVLSQVRRGTRRGRPTGARSCAVLTPVLLALLLVACGRPAEPRADALPSGDVSAPVAEAAGAPSQEGPRPLVTGQAPAGVTGELVFQSDVRGRPKIFHLALPSGAVTQLTQGDDVRDETPRWSPDGQRIAFASNRAFYGEQAETGEPVLDLYVMDAGGGN